MFKSSQYISTIISYFLLQGLSASTVYVKLPKLGGINGYYQKSANGRQVSAFEGIPYAQLTTSWRTQISGTLLKIIFF